MLWIPACQPLYSEYLMFHSFCTQPLSHSISSAFHLFYTHCTNAQALSENLNFRDRSVWNFFHSLPQTSWNLSFSLQWSNGDVCSSLVQLNFKKLYAHARYHYCKHNYHKLSLQPVAKTRLCESSGLFICRY